MENFRVCRRCLTRDMMDKAAYFQNMYDYINNLDESLRTACAEPADALWK